MSVIKKRVTKDLNHGSVTVTMLLFALPLLGASLVQMFYNTADMIIVGQFVGRNGLGSVSIGGDILHFIAFVSLGFCSAGQVIISQFVGAGMKEKVGKIIGTMFSFIFLAATALGGTVLFFRKEILSWINTPEELFADTENYLIICMLGIIFIFGYNVVSAILRGMGDSRHPLIFVAITATLNVILDLVLVIFFDMGICGVALATVISQFICLVISMFFMWRNRKEFGFDFKLRSFAIKKESLAPLLKLGIPMMLQSASISFSMIFVDSWINSYGVTVIAMNGIGNKTAMLVNVVNLSLALAASPMVGQAIGAGKYERVPKIIGVSTTVNMSISIAASILVVLAPRWVFGIFTDNAEVLDLSVSYVPVMLVLLLGSALRPPMNALINGSGNFKLNLAVGLLDGFIMRIGLSLLLGLSCGFGVFGFWYGRSIAGLAPFLVGIVYYISGKWKTRKHIIKS